MMFANFREQISNISTDIKRGSLNSGDDLGSMSAAGRKQSNPKYLGYDFQPGVNFHR